MNKLIQIHPDDNVAVAVHPICAGEPISCAGKDITALEEIPQGHKIALADIPQGSFVRKYGFPIGSASRPILAGQHVHTHNVRTNLSEQGGYEYRPDCKPIPLAKPRSFSGFLRPDGRAAVRNELWVLPMVGCVNSVAEKIVRNNQHLVSGTVEGLYTFPHPYGCSQMGEDHSMTRKLLAALVNHPNAGGVLVLALGCENNTLDGFREELGSWDDNRVKFLTCQDVEDEYEAAANLLEELAQYAGRFQRCELPASKLVIGMKCGGSDGLSGITANPAVGRFSDLLIAQGGSTILTEVPEMFGGESILLNRCKDETIFQKAASMIDSFKQYFVSHGQVVYENPSPGNKAGGITTLEDKSLGCVQKGGTAPVNEVLGYAEQAVTPGLSLLWGPGNDLVSSTALAASGAHIVLFTTGRGTPFGAPVPTLKIASNTQLFEKKQNWIDFNAGMVADGESLDSAGNRLLDLVLEAASGTVRTKAEVNGCREIAIFKDGVTL